MARNAKNPAQELTVRDKEILEEIALRYLVKFYALIQRYPNPKKYAKEVIIKSIQLNANIAILYTANFTKNYSSNIFTPGQLNQTLANDIQKTISEDYITLRKEGKEFLHPRDLRERILRKLENEGVFIRLPTKKEIRKQKIYHPGRGGSSNKIRKDRGGRPSAYILGDEIGRLKYLFRNPETMDFLYNEIIKSSLAYKFAKYKVMAFLYAAKMDERALHRLMGVGASFMQKGIRKEDSAKFKLLYQGLQYFDDNMLEQYAGNVTRSLIGNRGYYTLLFMSAILRI